ncbi:MAG: nucleotide exchange factor GrpE, partial [Bacteroidales bacterium]|nr:nucleotide exchange factor GrpE [Bacteroidales bacterium]
MATEEEKKEPVKENAKKEKKEGNAKLKEAQKEIQELKDTLSAEKDKYLRLYAEFDTFRRRSAEERLNLVASAAADTIKGLLPVLDDCESALKL